MKWINSILLAFCVTIGGCEVVNPVWPDERPAYKEISQVYTQTVLKESSSADVLSVAQMSEYELLSQSKSVVASLGQKEKGSVTWLTMVAFDEDDFTAKRKYLFLTDEPTQLEKDWSLVDPKSGMKFDCEVVLGSEILAEPYSNENAKLIAILKQAKDNVRNDIDEVASDNKMIGICGMAVNQALETVLVKLDGSPALAAKMSGTEGLVFNHINLNKGNIKMTVDDDIAFIRLRLGSFLKK